MKRKQRRNRSGEKGKGFRKRVRKETVVVMYYMREESILSEKIEKEKNHIVAFF